MSFALAVSAHAQSVLADKIQAGDRRAALELIDKSANVNQTQPDGTTPLHWAVYKIDRELVQALLRKGARAHVVNRYGASPLGEAVRVANAELVAMLLEAGADANVANEDGQTPLMLAARTGNVAVAKLLVQHGADVNRREHNATSRRCVGGGAEPSRHGRVPGVDEGRPRAPCARNEWESQITSNEPRVQYRPTGGLTPLLYAARAGCLDGVKTMLAAGALDWPNPTDDADDDGARQRVPGRRALPARSKRQFASLGLVGAHAACNVAVTMRGGLDGRAGRRPPESLELIKTLPTAVRTQRAARVQGTEPRRT